MVGARILDRRTGIAVVVAVLLIIAAWQNAVFLNPFTSVDRIGPRWYLVSTHSAMSHGSYQPRLFRRTWWHTKLVAELVQVAKYYDGDCVVYMSTSRSGGYFAACSERRPVMIANADGGQWRIDERGLVLEGGWENRNGRVLQRVSKIPIDAIKRVALEQPRTPRYAQPSRLILKPTVATEPLGTRPLASATAALMQAIHQENTDLVRQLIASRADVNGMVDSWCPIAAAAASGNVEILDLLLAAGADVNLRTAFGETALMIAAERGQEAAVKRLLRAGADVNAVDTSGFTALWGAEQSDHTEIARLLREAGAKEHPELPDFRSATH